MWHRGEGAVAWCLWTPSSRAAARKRVLGRLHKRARIGVAAVAAAASKREDMKVFKNTGRHMGARKPSRLPRGISKIAVRIMIVAYATDYPMSTF